MRQAKKESAYPVKLLGRDAPADLRRACGRGRIAFDASAMNAARFLAGLSEHHAAQGLSPRCLRLPMTRRDIGSYMSVTLETVSRALSALSHLEIIEVSNRDITILNMEALVHYEG